MPYTQFRTFSDEKLGGPETKNDVQYDRTHLLPDGSVVGHFLSCPEKAIEKSNPQESCVDCWT
jgi:hypothetical protein